ncbi:DUF393 domain-containing protein [Bacillaceae bacterium SIJ1]|nr:DUF393 domain-containing protein [Litoribacterium kuwaitense]
MHSSLVRHHQRPIVFFDGECSFCDAAVQFLIRHDPNKRLYFASLQSDLAANLLDSKLKKNVARFNCSSRCERCVYRVRRSLTDLSISSVALENLCCLSFDTKSD